MRLLVIGALPPPTGGVATHIHEIVRGLRALDVEVTAVDPRRHGRLLSSLALARARGDLIHVHTNGHNRRSWLLAALCAGPRSILTLHSGLAPAYIAEHRRATRTVTKLYKEVIAVNQEIALSLDVQHILPAWTPRSLEFRLSPPGLRQLRARHRPLYAAALAPGPEYGATLLLDAFSRLPLPHKASCFTAPALSPWPRKSLAAACGNRSHSWESFHESARWP